MFEYTALYPPYAGASSPLTFFISVDSVISVVNFLISIITDFQPACLLDVRQRLVPEIGII